MTDRPEIQEPTPSCNGVHPKPRLASTTDIAQGVLVKVAPRSYISEDVPLQAALTMPSDKREQTFVSPKDIPGYPKAGPRKRNGGRLKNNNIE